MDVLITRSVYFDRSVKRLAKRYASMKQDLINLVESLRRNPEAGVSLGGRLRKVRMPIAAKGRGKSGGARVITYTLSMTEEGVLEIRLLYVYDKSERATMTDKELEALVRACGL